MREGSSERKRVVIDISEKMWGPCVWMCRACGRRVRFPAREDTKTFGDVGDLLTSSVSAGLSKYSGFVHLIHIIQSHEQHQQILATEGMHH